MMKIKILFLAIMAVSGCFSCSLLDKFSGEVKVRPFPFKPFSVNSDSLIFLNDVSCSYFVIDTIQDKIIGTFRFEVTGPQGATGNPTLNSLIVQDKIYVVPSCYEDYPTLEMWVIYPEKGTGKRIAISWEMPEQLHYLPSYKKLTVDHSFVYCDDQGGGNVATTVIDTVNDVEETTFFTWRGTHSLIEGLNGNVYCITGWYGSNTLSQLNMTNYQTIPIGTNIHVGESSGYLNEGSSICNPVSNRILVADYYAYNIRVYNADIRLQVDTIDMPYTNEYHPIWIRYYAPLDYIITGHRWADTPHNALITVHNQTTKALVASIDVPNGSDGFDVKNGKIYVFNAAQTPCTVSVYDMNNGCSLVKTIELK